MVTPPYAAAHTAMFFSPRRARRYHVYLFMKMCTRSKKCAFLLTAPYFEAMVNGMNTTHQHTRQTSSGPHTASPQKFWKDASVLGSVLSALLLGIMVLALFSPESGIPKVQEVLEIKEQLAHEIEELREANERILAEIEAIQTDPFWQEKIAREELNMALPGEIIYKFTE